MESIIDNKSFEEKVTNSNKPVLLDFYAPWCAPCKMLEKTLEKVAPEYADSVDFFQINVDEAMDVSVKFQVSALPTLVMCKNGECVKKNLGLLSESELKQFIDEVLSAK